MMKMTRWHKFRAWLLIVIFGSVLFVLLKAVFHPQRPNLVQTNFTLPEAIALPNWQMLASSPLSINQKFNFAASRRYRYQQQNLTLEIDLYYATHTLGDVKSWFQEDYQVSLETTEKIAIRQNPEVGFYGLFLNQGKAYLSGCINPRGGSTVTIDQFRENRNNFDIQPSRIIPWLLGLAELRDWRCLWSVLSIPAEKDRQSQAYTTLETAWFSWYQWWHSRFPPP